MKAYTTTELTQMAQMRKEGASYQEIAEMFGHSKFSVQKKLSEMGVLGKQPEPLKKKKGQPAAEVAKTIPPMEEAKPKPSAAAPVVSSKKVTLDDFSPREMIKHLYNLGYRIENNAIVFYQRQVVNIKSVLEE